ncbi:MAG: hypothetical protein M3345_01305 [Actinomycetota bacterium]|nr:hypothetical protein [Actinomycetota bacterium]
MKADIAGTQRKTVRSEVRPARGAYDEKGIRLRKGTSRPFTVARSWSAPAGHYQEAWYLVDPSTREVLFEGPTRDVLILGLQALTEITDTVTVPIALRPGSYEFVFALGGLKGGELTVEAAEVTADAAA